MAGSCTRDDNVHRSRSTFRLYRSPSLQRTLCHHQGKLSLSESARPPLSVVLIRDTSFVRCGAALEVESLDLVDANQNKWGSIFTPRLEIAIVYYLKLRTRPSRSQAASRGMQGKCGEEEVFRDDLDCVTVECREKSP